MNPINFFKFLEKTKDRPVPLGVKIALKLPLTPEDLNVKGDLDLMDISAITSLPDGLKVGGGLILSGTSITSLPNGLVVGDELSLYALQIKSLPKDLQVGGNLMLLSTPLAKKYTAKQIRKMVPGVKGEIWLG